MSEPEKERVAGLFVDCGENCEGGGPVVVIHKDIGG